MSAGCVLALDEGSSSARAVLVGPDGQILGEARNPVVPRYPAPGCVELDPEAVWSAQHRSIQQLFERVGVRVRDLAAVGVTTSRETALIWDRRTGEPIHNAIMWMSHQTDSIVRRWESDGLGSHVRNRTGLRNDSFFTAGKLAWILEHVPGARQRAERGELAAGTLDTWLLWKLTGGRVHRTDHSEASRTALFSLADLDWDPELCHVCGVPRELLADVDASDAHFGECEPDVLGDPDADGVPIRAVLGDQQAGMIGQACFTPGSVKNTFGTAGVLTAHCGATPVLMDGLTSSVAWTLGKQTVFEAEGVVFHSGQTLHWLRDRLGLIGPDQDIETLARQAPDTGGVYLVPAFSGLCAPHWNRDTRASIVGLTLETSAEQVVRAGLEAMAYQTRDNLDALYRGGIEVPALKVDGGAAGNDLLCQFQADICGIPVVRPAELERTALGVAYVAGAGAGLWRVPEDIDATWRPDRVFEPAMEAHRREELYAGWREALQSVLATRAEVTQSG